MTRFFQSLVRSAELSAIVLAALMLTPAGLFADITLPDVISDGMVIQQGKTTPVFGKAGPGEEVTVSFRGKTFSAKAGDDGRWNIPIDTGTPGGPFELTVNGANAVDLKDIYVGDVWLCSGQSNMVDPVVKSLSSDAAAQHEPNELLRLYTATRDKKWSKAEGIAVQHFSAVGYFFGRELQRTQGIPIGLVNASVGGSSAEEWVTPAVLNEIGIEHTKGRAVAGGWHQKHITPLQPIGLRGVIWYQGESNRARYVDYQRLMTALIDEWRDEWSQPDLPFYFVQLARFDKPEDEISGGLREAQRRTLVVPNTGMAVSYDVSDGQIHPPDKEPMGKRLALIARARVYGESIEDSGPMFRSARREGNDIIVEFDHADDLRAEDGPLRGFEFSRDGQNFEAAEARIADGRVMISASSAEGPFVVRYAWGAFPKGNLYNAADLPASPFTSAERLEESDRIIASRQVKELVSPLTNRSATPDEVRAIADQVEQAVRSSELLQQELGKFCRILVGSKPFKTGGYGIPVARETLQRWAKEYGKGGR